MYLYSAEVGADAAADGTAELAVGADAADGAVLAAGADSLPDCDEGELAWIPEERIFELPMWEGDRLFLEQIIEGRESISMTLHYEGDKLIT